MCKSIWYVLYTMPQHERKVAAQLADEKLPYYLPFCKKVSNWHDRKKVIDVPLFPSYIFVNISTTEDFYKCLSFSGVVKFVNFGKEYAKVQETVIRDIDMLCSNATALETSTKLLEAGQPVRIKEGPLAGLNCEVVEHKQEKKILMRFHLFNRDLIATVPLELIATEI